MSHGSEMKNCRTQRTLQVKIERQQGVPENSRPSMEASKYRLAGTSGLPVLLFRRNVSVRVLPRSVDTTDPVHTLLTVDQIANTRIKVVKDCNRGIGC